MAHATNARQLIKNLGLGLLIGLFFFTIAVLYRMVQINSMSDKQLVEKRESIYNNIFIYKDDTGKLHMIFGYRGRNFTESVHNPADALELPVGYTRWMSVGLVYAQDAKDLLFIGMGGGKTSSYLEAFLPQLHITEVELDPEVVALAKKYFAFQPSQQLDVAVQDGRKYLMDSPSHYDLIMVDAYRGPFVPFHLLTVNFYQEVKKHLREGGVVVQNIAPDTMLFDSAIVTLHQVFDQVEIYPVQSNVVAVAYNGAQKTADELQQKATQLQAQYHFRYPLPALLDKRKFYTPKGDVLPLTDDFAPVDSLKSIESHNRKWE